MARTSQRFNQDFMLGVWLHFHRRKVAAGGKPLLAPLPIPWSRQTVWLTIRMITISLTQANEPA